MKKIAIFASGSGTNAENIINFFNYNLPYKYKNNPAKVSLLICNKPNAYVLERAERLNVPQVVLSKESLCKEDSEELLYILKEYQIDYLVLAGYLLKIPEYIISKFENKIINIHPALLPKFGGKGMYGHHVHQAVVDAKEKESGITIHLVDKVYDNGQILFQAKCQVTSTDTPEDVAAKIHLLEQEFFPKIIADTIKVY